MEFGADDYFVRDSRPVALRVPTYPKLPLLRKPIRETTARNPPLQVVSSSGLVGLFQDIQEGGYFGS